MIKVERMEGLGEEVLAVVCVNKDGNTVVIVDKDKQVNHVDVERMLEAWRAFHGLAGGGEC
jgi:hypothetical protein